MQQATDENGELLYVNKYGELQPFSEVEDLLVNRKTQKFNLDDLTDVRTSTPATITGGKNLLGADLSADQGFNFKSWDAIDSAADLSQFMTIDIDNSGSPVTVNLSGLYEQGLVTGARLADFIQDQLNDKFGDERYFDLTASSNRSVKVTVQNKSVTLDASIDPTKPKVNGNGQPFADLTRVTIDDVVASLQAQVTEAEIGLTVGYDSALRSFTFVPTNTSDNVTIESAVQNTLFGTNSSVQSVGPDGTWGAVVTPNGDLRRPAIEQRYGITVAYDGAQETFSFSSGTTGDRSEIDVSFNVGGDKATDFARFMGFDISTGTTSFTVDQSAVAERGVESLPAITRGSSIAVNVNNNFSVDASNNTFVVSVNDVKGTVQLPIGAGYTLDSLINGLETAINQLATESGSSVSGSRLIMTQRRMA